MPPDPIPRILAEQRAAADALPDPGAKLGLFDWTAEEVLIRTTLPATCGECAFCKDKLRHLADCTYYPPTNDPRGEYPFVFYRNAPPDECPIRKAKA